jgi:hypothetical protein
MTSAVYKPTVAVKGSRVPFTQRRTSADLLYIEWLAEHDATLPPVQPKPADGDGGAA